MDDDHSQIIDDDAVLSGTDGRTMCMLRNIPGKVVAGEELVAILDSLAVHGTYNLLYLPIDRRNLCGFGYAFLNCKDGPSVIKLRNHVEGFTWSGFRSKKRATVHFAKCQGTASILARYLGPSLPGGPLPILFDCETGGQIAFPPETAADRARLTDILGAKPEAVYQAFQAAVSNGWGVGAASEAAAEAVRALEGQWAGEITTEAIMTSLAAVLINPREPLQASRSNARDRRAYQPLNRSRDERTWVPAPPPPPQRPDTHSRSHRPKAYPYGQQLTEVDAMYAHDAVSRRHGGPPSRMYPADPSALPSATHQYWTAGPDVPAAHNEHGAPPRMDLPMAHGGRMSGGMGAPRMAPHAAPFQARVDGCGLSPHMYPHPAHAGGRSYGAGGPAEALWPQSRYDRERHHGYMHSQPGHRGIGTGPSGEPDAALDGSPPTDADSFFGRYVNPPDAGSHDAQTQWSALPALAPRLSMLPAYNSLGFGFHQPDASSSAASVGPLPGPAPGDSTSGPYDAKRSSPPTPHATYPSSAPIHRVADVYPTSSVPQPDDVGRDTLTAGGGDERQ